MYGTEVAMGQFLARPELLLPTLPLEFTYSQGRAKGLSRRALEYLTATGALELIERGLYRRADAPLADLGLIAIAIRAPRATLCLGSALVRYGLSDEIPAAPDIALPRGVRTPMLDAPARWHHFNAETFDLGRSEIALDEQTKIGLYSPERSIIDAFRTHATEGNEQAVTALRRWVRQRGSQPSALLALAEHWPRTRPALLKTLEVLL
jgi:predicted transcriptional regulator of viral defense system